MTDVLTMGDLGSALRSRWRLILASTTCFALAGLAVSLVLPTTYTAQAVLIVMAAPADQDGVYPAAQFAEKRAATYPALVGSPQVIDATREDLGLDMSYPQLVRVVSAVNPTDSPLVEVSATSEDPLRARDIADTTADELASYALRLERNGSRIESISIQKAVPATEPQSPSSPSPLLLVGLGTLVGLALGVVGALALRTWQPPPLRLRRRRDTVPDQAAAEPADRDPSPSAAAPEDDTSDAPPETPDEGEPAADRRVVATASDEVEATSTSGTVHSLGSAAAGRGRGPRGPRRARRPITTADAQASGDGSTAADLSKGASSGARR